jgi:hypothetical protein
MFSRAEVWVRFAAAAQEANTGPLTALDADSAAREADEMLYEFDKRFTYHTVYGWMPKTPTSSRGQRG